MQGIEVARNEHLAVHYLAIAAQQLIADVDKVWGTRPHFLRTWERWGQVQQEKVVNVASKADTGVGGTGVGDTGVGDTGVGDTGVGSKGVRDTGVGDTGVGDTGVGDLSRSGEATVRTCAHGRECTCAAPTSAQPRMLAADRHCCMPQRPSLHHHHPPGGAPQLAPTHPVQPNPARLPFVLHSSTLQPLPPAIPPPQLTPPTATPCHSSSTAHPSNPYPLPFLLSPALSQTSPP
eukprot:338703-Chlamydomonas_euryale.AAC.1